MNSHYTYVHVCPEDSTGTFLNHAQSSFYLQPVCCSKEGERGWEMREEEGERGRGISCGRGGVNGENRKE